MPVPAGFAPRSEFRNESLARAFVDGCDGLSASKTTWIFNDTLSAADAGDHMHVNLSVSIVSMTAFALRNPPWLNQSGFNLFRDDVLVARNQRAFSRPYPDRMYRLRGYLLQCGLSYEYSTSQGDYDLVYPSPHAKILATFWEPL